jgi:ectoine hydroxylase-related dioxygenase (phytanoyl-CoA dioxygenase family)
VDLDIMPSVGKLVLFEPWMRHGVRENRSNTNRLSLAFNLFPFPLPADNL